MKTASQYEAINSFYSLFIKRLLDIILSILTIVMFFWLFILIGILVKINLGSPIIFKQPRPGKINKKNKKETIFLLYKFRTMTDERDNDNNLLPDRERLTKFGKFLRATSLDELPEIWNILIGDMSLIGPRPQLIKDMVFMTKEQRNRHLIRPGLSGLAQISGRNALAWEYKLKTDLKYMENMSFRTDLIIVIKTLVKLLKHDAKTNEIDICDDFGDYLLNNQSISLDYYQKKQLEANTILSIYLNKETLY